MSKDGKTSSIDTKLKFTVIGFVGLLIIAVVLLVLVSKSEEDSRGAERFIRLSGQTGSTRSRTMVERYEFKI